MAVTLKDCTEALRRHGAVIITFTCYESAKQAPRGRIELPKQGEKCIGAHCVALYDVSPEEQCFYFKNSWGEQWGDRGHGSLPFSYVENGLVTELMVLG